MATYKCSKCGDSAESKCVHQRSVFPENGEATLLTYAVRAKVVDPPKCYIIEGQPEEESFRSIQFEVMLKKEQYSDEELVQVGLNFIERNLDNLRIALCNHDWEIQSGQCLFGCCIKEVPYSREEDRIIVDMVNNPSNRLTLPMTSTSRFVVDDVRKALKAAGFERTNLSCGRRENTFL